MALEDTYTSQDKIPVGYETLYVQDGEQFTLRAPTDIKTVDDTTALQNALAKERNDHKSVKSLLQQFDGIDAKTVREQLDEIESLRASATPNTAVEDQVAQKLNATKAPLEREIAKLQAELEAKTETITGYETTSKKAKINGEIQSALNESKVRADAMAELSGTAAFLFELTDDGVRTKDGIDGVPVGLSPAEWLEAKKSSTPYYWPESTGADAKGGNHGAVTGKNPFSNANWSGMEQNRIYKENPERAHKMAEAAGTTVGGSKPKA